MIPTIALSLLLAAQAGGDQPAGEAVEVDPVGAASSTDDGAVEDAAVAPAPAASAPSVKAPTAAPDSSLEGALADLMDNAADAVRIAVPAVTDDDEPRGQLLQAAIVRALLDRGREEVVTPAMVKRVLGDAAAQMALGEPASFGVLSADHVLLGEVVDAGGKVQLRMRLIHVQSGGVLGTVTAPVAGAARETTAVASTVRGGLERAVDQLVVALGNLPGDPRYQRIAVSPIAAQGDAAVESRVDRFLQSELLSALSARGYLIVERAQIAAAMDQLALGAALGEDNAGELGKMLDAQVVVVGSVSDAGDRFSLALRAISVETGTVLGAAESQIPREGVVTLASGSIETKSAGEAAFRSLVAPGWGQFYNRQPVKGALFAAASYGGAVTTVGLGIGSAVLWSVYGGYCVDGCETPPEKRGAEVKALREQTNALLTATLVSGIITGVAWGAGAADALIEGVATYAE